MRGSYLCYRIDLPGSDWTGTGSQQPIGLRWGLRPWRWLEGLEASFSLCTAHLVGPWLRRAHSLWLSVWLEQAQVPALPPSSFMT